MHNECCCIDGYYTGHKLIVRADDKFYEFNAFRAR